MSDKSKLAFALPSSLKTEIRAHVVKEGYGLRGKSQWISESVMALLSLKDYPELISLNDEMYGFDEMETVVIDYKLKQLIDKAILKVRKEYPTLEGVKSRIFRTAIMQRIIRQ